VLAVIGAIAVAALLVYKYWEPIKAYFAGVWQGFKENIDMVMPAWEGIKAAFGGIVDAVASVVEIFVPLQEGQESTGRAMEIGAKVGHGLATALMVIATVAKWVCQGVEAVVITIVTLIDVAVSAFKTLWEIGKKAAEAIASPSKMFTKDFWADGGSKIGGVWSGMGGRFMDRLENSSMNPDKKAKDVAAPALPTDAGAKDGGAAGIAAKAKKEGKQGQDAPVMVPDKKGGKGGAPGAVAVHYEPKITFNGDVKQEDKEWFRKQLDAHKGQIAKLVQEQLEEQRRWMA
jgi:hypothetical protein